MFQLKSNSKRASQAILAFSVLLSISCIYTLLVVLVYGYDFSGGILSSTLSLYAMTFVYYIIGICQLLNIIVYIAAIVFFIRWFRRAYWNLHQVTDYLYYSEESAAWSWFVPFVNLYRPFVIMKDIWRCTQSEVVGEDKAQKAYLIGIWWTLWVIIFLLSITTTNGILRLNFFIGINQRGLVLNLISLVDLALLIVIIRKIKVFETAFYNKFNEKSLDEHLIG